MRSACLVGWTPSCSLPLSSSIHLRLPPYPYTTNPKNKNTHLLHQQPRRVGDEGDGPAPAARARRAAHAVHVGGAVYFLYVLLVGAGLICFAHPCTQTGEAIKGDHNHNSPPQNPDPPKTLTGSGASRHCRPRPARRYKQVYIHILYIYTHI